MRVRPPRLRKTPEDAAGRVVDPPERAALEFAGAVRLADRLEAGEHALPGGERWLAARLGLHEDGGRRAVAVPAGRAGDGVAIGIGAGDLDDHRLGQAVAGARKEPETRGAPCGAVKR